MARTRHLITSIITTGAALAALLAGQHPSSSTDTGHPATAVALSSTTTGHPAGAQANDSDSDATGDATGARYSRGLAARAVGRLFRADGTSCTATVIHSPSGTVAVTAAHCVWVPRQRGNYSDTPWLSRSAGPIALDRFVPGSIGSTEPYGSWQIRSVHVHPRWVSSDNPRYDVAFIVLDNSDGQTAEDILGAERISFTTYAHPRSLAVTALGYPADGRFDGTTLRRCSTTAVTKTDNDEFAMDCAMTGGASGGPWLTGFNQATGRGVIVAVTAYRHGDDPELNATPLTEEAATVYRRADRAGAADMSALHRGGDTADAGGTS